jgi:hypothetical protein
MLGSRDWLGADVAQLAEHLICNQAVASSTLAVSSDDGESASVKRVITVGYPSGQREQTVNLPAHAFEGSNPSPTMVAGLTKSEERSTAFAAGVAQLVEREPSKLDVAGSSPVSRSIGRGPLA